MADFINKLKNEEGSGLILALMTLMVLAVLGASLGTITIGSHRLSSVNRDSTSAYYIAEAGANQAFEEIKGYVYDAHESTSGQSSFFNRVDELANPYFGGQSINDFSSQFGDSPESVVTLSRVNENGVTVSYELSSLGRVDGREREVIKAFDVTYVSESVNDIVPEAPQDVAIISEGEVDIKPNAEINGEIRVSSEAVVNRIRNKNNVSKGITYPISNWENYTKLLDITSILESDFEQLPPDGKILTDKNVPIFIETDNLNLDSISVSGEGIVNIVVTDNILFDGNQSEFGESDLANNVRIFYMGNSPFTVDKRYTLNAALYIDKAPINIDNSVTFGGVILYNGIKDLRLGVHSSFVKSYIIAPNAKVIIRNHVEFTGAIVAKEVGVDNRATVTYEKVGSYPFSFKGIVPEEDTESDSIFNELINASPIIEPK